VDSWPYESPKAAPTRRSPATSWFSRCSSRRSRAARVAGGPAGPAQQPVAGDPQRQRQIPAQLGHLLDLGVRRRGGTEDRPEQPGRLDRGQRPQLETAGAFQASQQAPAGDQGQAAAAGRQQRPDLRLVGGVVQDDQRPLVPQQGAVQPGPVLRIRRDRGLGGAEGTGQPGQGGRAGQRLGVHAPQVEEERSVRELSTEYVRRVHCEGGLAQAGRPRHQGHGGGAGAGGTADQGGELVQLGAATGEVGHRPGQFTPAGPGPGAHRLKPAGLGRRRQRRLLGRRQAECLGERQHGAALWTAAAPAFHVADAADADPRRLRQLLQGESGGAPVRPKQRSEPAGLSHAGRLLRSYGPRIPACGPAWSGRDRPDRMVPHRPGRAQAHRSNTERRGITMSTWTARLGQLGITLPAAPGSAPAVRTAGLVHTSTHLPLVDGALPVSGVVGAGIGVQQAADLARTAALNALAAVDAAAGIDSVVRVVKVVGYVAAGPEFTGHAAVLEGATDLLAQVFGTAGSPAGTAVGVTGLPLGAPVGVELLVAVWDRPAQGPGDDRPESGAGGDRPDPDPGEHRAGGFCPAAGRHRPPAAPTAGAGIGLAFDLLHTGRWDEADQLLDRIVDLSGRPSLAVRGRYGQALLAAARGDTTRARRLTAGMVGSGVRPAELYGAHARALAALGRGDYAEAYDQAAAVTRPGELPVDQPQVLAMALDLAEAAVRTGRQVEAAAYVAALRRAGGRRPVAAAGAAGGRRGGGGRPVRPGTGAVRGGPRGAAGRPLELRPRRIRLCYGERLRRDGHARQARVQLTSALDTVDRSGGDPVGGPGPAPSCAPPRRPGPGPDRRSSPHRSARSPSWPRAG
jgi:enamine deaminase RidA (YjgF/YER057c/UK114 family)